MTRLLPTALAALALASPLAAQRFEPWLAVNTTHRGVALQAMDVVGKSETLPDLKRGESWRLLANKEGELQIDVQRDLIGTAQIVIRPALLPAGVKAQLAAALSTTATALGTTLERSGMAPGDSATVTAAALGLVDQLASIRIRIGGDPDVLDKNLLVEFWLRPLPDTWLASATNTFVHNPVGIPRLGEEGTVLTLRAAYYTQEPEPMLKPVAAMLPRTGAQAAPEHDAMELAMEMLQSLRGDISMSLNHNGEALYVIGIGARTKAPELYSSDSFRQWMSSTEKTHPDVDVEFTADAIEHGGVSLHRSVTTLGGALSAGPPYKDGVLVSYYGVAGPYFLGAVGTDDAGARAMIDKIRSSRFSSPKLGPRVLAILTVRLRDFLDMQTGGAAATDGLPERVRVTLANAGDQILVKVKIL